MLSLWIEAYFKLLVHFLSLLVEHGHFKIRYVD